MEAKEKAKALVEIFWTEVEDNDYETRKMSFNQAKQCALLEIEGRIESVNNILNHDKNRYGISSRGCVIELHKLNEVKQEIEKL